MDEFEKQNERLKYYFEKTTKTKQDMIALGFVPEVVDKVWYQRAKKRKVSTAELIDRGLSFEAVDSLERRSPNIVNGSKKEEDYISGYIKKSWGFARDTPDSLFFLKDPALLKKLFTEEEFKAFDFASGFTMSELSVVLKELNKLQELSNELKNCESNEIPTVSKSGKCHFKKSPGVFMTSRGKFKFIGAKTFEARQLFEDAKVYFGEEPWLRYSFLHGKIDNSWLGEKLDKTKRDLAGFLTGDLVLSSGESSSLRSVFLNNLDSKSFQSIVEEIQFQKKKIRATCMEWLVTSGVKLT